MVIKFCKRMYHMCRYIDIGEFKAYLEKAVGAKIIKRHVVPRSATVVAMRVLISSCPAVVELCLKSSMVVLTLRRFAEMAADANFAIVTCHHGVMGRKWCTLLSGDTGDLLLVTLRLAAESC